MATLDQHPALNIQTQTSAISSRIGGQGANGKIPARRTLEKNCEAITVLWTQG